MTELLREVEKIAEMVEAGLKINIKNPVPPYKNSIVKDFSKLSNEIAAGAFGVFGKRCKNFVDFYDTEHPQMEHLSNQLNSCESEIRDCLSLADQFVQNKNSGLLRIINDFFNLNPLLSSFMIGLKNAPIRMLADKADREFARVTGIINIDIDKGIRLQKAPKETKSSLVNTSEIAEFWTLVSDTFENFVRLRKSNPETIGKLTAKSEQLTNMGMIYQAKTYTRKLQEIKNKSQATYCGFRKINYSEAAAILGKSHGFQKNQRFVIEDSNDPKLIKLISTVFPNHEFVNIIMNFFGISNWDRNKTISENCHKHNLNELLDYISSRFKINCFEYCPRVYSLHVFQTIMSAETKNMLNQLDEFADLAGKPLFDRYSVVVPGFICTDSLFVDNGRIKLKINGEVFEYLSHHDFYTELDTTLIKEKLICPVILGQKDGDFYFVNYLR